MTKRDKKSEIMRAAENLFTNRQYHQITLDEIAKIAKVGKGTIYRHFKDKEDLFVQTAVSGFGEICRVLQRDMPKEATLKKRLTIVCRRMGDFYDQRGQLFRMMQSEELRAFWHREDVRRDFHKGRRAVLDAVAEIITQGAAEGGIRDDVSPRVLAHFLLGMLRMQARILADTVGTRKRHELVVELFLYGAARGDGGGPRKAGPGK